MKQVIAVGFALAFGLAVSGSARADPVVYTLYAVTDGKLGSQTFSQAQVTIAFRGDTRNVVMETMTPGAVVYRNSRGEATVTLIQGASKTVAHIAAGQIYVRYDTTNGVVGFGSFATGPTYPIMLSCDFPSPNTNCTYGPPSQGPFSQLVSALADIAAVPQDASLYSTNVSALPTKLTDSTLLTGYVSACGVAYDSSGACPSPPATPIHTDLGDFYLQDHGAVDGKGIFTVVVGEED